MSPAFMSRGTRCLAFAVAMLGACAFAPVAMGQNALALAREPDRPWQPWSQVRRGITSCRVFGDDVSPGVAVFQKGETQYISLRGARYRAETSLRLAFWQVQNGVPTLMGVKALAGRPGESGLVEAFTLDFPTLSGMSVLAVENAAGDVLDAMPFSSRQAYELSRCAGEVAREFKGTGKPQAQKPEFLIDRAGIVSGDDYPARALRDGVSGLTKIRLIVSAKGVPSECGISGSSGSVDLDDVTCRKFLRLAKFTPALDADGRPTEGWLETQIRWAIPE